MADLLQVIDLLFRGFSYSDIRHQLGVGNSIIQRASKILKDIAPIRDQILENINSAFSNISNYRRTEEQYRGGFKNKLLKEIKAKIELGFYNAKFLIQQLREFYRGLEPWLTNVYLRVHQQNLNTIKAFLDSL